MRRLVMLFFLFAAFGLVLTGCTSISVTPESLEKTIFENDTTSLEKLLRRGADPNLSAEGHLAPLYIAVGMGHYEAAELLLDYGAYPDALTDEGGTPVTFAIQQGFEDIAVLLIKKGCSISLRNNYGQTPLMFASQFGAREVAEILLEKGAEINAKANDGTSPLFFAVVFGQATVVDLLIDAGADVNMANTYGQTALMAAAAMNNIILVSRLILDGADLNMKDNRGYTAVQYAVLQNKKEATILLMESGAQTAFPFSRTMMLPENLPASSFFHSDSLQSISLTVAAPGSLFPEMIPYRINYARPPDENYRIAVENLQDFLNRGFDGCSLFGDVLMTGPYLTRAAGRVSALKDIFSTSILMRIYEADAVLEKIYINEYISYPANYFRNRLMVEGDLNIRAPRPDELDWYWTIIPYELDDVILVIESSKSTFFLEFNDGNLIYLDDWTWLDWKM